MRVLKQTDGDQTFFVLADLDEAQEEGARRMNFAPTADGMARGFPSSSPHLDSIYETMRDCAPDLLAQRGGRAPVPWEATLEYVLARIEGLSFDWMLVGSVALALRGLPVTPGDVDFAVDGAGALLLGDALLDALIEPVVPVTGWVCDWFGRAFHGALVEWVGAVHDDMDAPERADFGPVAYTRRETVVWRGRSIAIPPLDLQLAVSERRGLTERAALIRVALRQ